jgi:hypothetical protein
MLKYAGDILQQILIKQTPAEAVLDGWISLTFNFLTISNS